MADAASASDIIKFAGYFLLGLAVNLTPCVYPMFTVTLSLFQPEFSKAETLKHSFFKAVSYFLGLAAMYSALGYFAASTGKLFGSFLQNPWVLGSVGVMMFALALSMFGLFKLRPSAELLSKLAVLRRADYVGLFLSGVLVGIFAAPCVGPPVLTLISEVALRGDPAFGLTAFFIFACGMGLPYLLLGTFFNLTTKLPKAGKWLIWVERFFGVILMGFAVFYIATALHVRAPQRVDGVHWKPYRVGEVITAAGAHKPVVIDFFAEWCLSCHEFEEMVLSRPDVVAELKKVATLRVDATNQDDPAVNSILEKFGIVGLPTIIFLDEHGDEIKQIRMEGAGSKRRFLKALALQAEHFKNSAGRQ